MRWFDPIFTRSGHAHCFGAAPPTARRRLRHACLDLSRMERRVQEVMGLSVPPCLLLVDEEQAVIMTPDRRAEIETEGEDESR